MTANSERPLNGRQALVTGADSGIGQGIAYELARRGAGVAITFVGSSAEAERMAEEINGAGGRALPIKMDVSKEDEVVAGFETAADALGTIDLLVNNAGVEAPYELTEMPLDEWQRVIDVNLTGAFLCSREAARGMRAANVPGAIVNITSVHEQIPWRRFSHYCASKGGTKLFAQSIARELAPYGIRVVNVAPGAIETPINRKVLADPEQRQAVLDQVPAGRWGRVEDVARTVAWVASEDAEYVVGSTIFVDGGMTLYPEFD